MSSTKIVKENIFEDDDRLTVRLDYIICTIYKICHKQELKNWYTWDAREGEIGDITQAISHGSIWISMFVLEGPDSSRYYRPKQSHAIIEGKKTDLLHGVPERWLYSV